MESWRTSRARAASGVVLSATWNWRVAHNLTTPFRVSASPRCSWTPVVLQRRFRSCDPNLQLTRSQEGTEGCLRCYCSRLHCGRLAIQPRPVSQSRDCGRALDS